MNIYARSGDKVVYDQPENGYEHEKNTAAVKLKAGQAYTVDRTVVNNYHTTVYLQEVPGVAFNSVLFSDA